MWVCIYMAHNHMPDIFLPRHMAISEAIVPESKAHRYRYRYGYRYRDWDIDTDTARDTFAAATDTSAKLCANFIAQINTIWHLSRFVGLFSVSLRVSGLLLGLRSTVYGLVSIWFESKRIHSYLGFLNSCSWVGEGSYTR